MRIMSIEADSRRSEAERKGFTGGQVAAIVLAVVLVTAFATFWVIRTYIYPRAFTPVTLNASEERVLEDKLARLQAVVPRADRQHSKSPRPATEQSPLEPEPYSEDPARRQIGLTEKEINALIAKNTDLATRLAIDLSDNLASAKLLIPLEDDFPILGGKTLRVHAGLELSYTQGRPVVILKGVSVMGVPIPNAWLGNLKNVDLVTEFGGNPGFWRAFAEGVSLIRVEEGELKIQLRE